MGQYEFYDHLLVVASQSGDKQAFRELVDRWQPRLYYYLRRIVEDESFVWDILQETWLAVFRDVRRLKNTGRFPRWLYQIAHNKAIDLLRRESRYSRIADEDIADLCDNDVTVPDIEGPAEQIHRLLDRLKPSQREVLTLHFLEGFAIADIARVVGVPEGTVKSRLCYAKKRLREMLKGTEDVGIKQ